MEYISFGLARRNPVSLNLIFEGQVDVTARLAWQSVASLYDERAARNLALLLQAEGVPTQVASDSKLIGDALVWEVCVPIAMLDRTQQLLGESPFTDAELEYLATDVLAGGKDPK